jgi:hypothetical protein
MGKELTLTKTLTHIFTGARTGVKFLDVLYWNAKQELEDIMFNECKNLAVCKLQLRPPVHNLAVQVSCVISKSSSSCTSDLAVAP